MSNCRIRLQLVPPALVVAICVIAVLPSGASGSDWLQDVMNAQLTEADLRPASSTAEAAQGGQALPSGRSGNDWLQDAMNVQLTEAYLRPASPATEVSQGGQGNGGQARAPSEFGDAWQQDVVNVELTDAFFRSGSPATGRVQAAQGNGGEAAPASSGQASTKELSQKTTDPTGDIAMVFTEFGVSLNDGDDNKGDTKAAASIVFQPVVPIPIHGTGDDEWRIVTRPTIALRIEDPIPQDRLNNFDRKTGLSDLNIPLPLALPRSMAGRWLLALGPDVSFPTATQDEFGRQQYSAGVTGILGYMAEDWIAGGFPQFYWGFADQGRDDDVKVARFGNMFYWYWYNLSDSLQVGGSPTITYDDQADSGNKWNVPVGLGISKMVNIGTTPVRIEVAAEYSVVHQDDFGRRWLFKVNIIPVVPRPIKRAIFGGG